MFQNRMRGPGQGCRGVCAAATLFLFSACMPADEVEWQDEAPLNRAVAVLHPTAGHTAAGTVTFTNVAGVYEVEAVLTGLEPGEHGFHIHEYGDCSAPDGTSAGGHFNPEDSMHGAPDDAVRHVGDLGNVTADSTGEARLEASDMYVSFRGEHSVIGRAVVVHAGADDFTSQPSGAAGPRVACGVIGIAAD